MSWTKLDDAILGDPKLMEAGLEAELVFIRGLVYCNRHLTDGFIPTGGLPEICRGFDIERVVLRLVSVGVWKAVTGGYQVINFLRYQRGKDKVEEDRKNNALRQQRLRDRLREKAARQAGKSNGVTVPIRIRKTGTDRP